MQHFFPCFIASTKLTWVHTINWMQSDEDMENNYVAFMWILYEIEYMLHSPISCSMESEYSYK